MRAKPSFLRSEKEEDIQEKKEGKEEQGVCMKNRREEVWSCGTRL